MWDDFTTLLADVIQRRGNRWKTLSGMLPMIIIGILYILGQIGKAAKNKPNQAPRQPQPGIPLQPTTTQSRRLPSYARGRTTVPQPTQRPPQPTAQPRTTQPTSPAPRPIIASSPAPQRVPRPAQPTAPKPSRRPTAEHKAPAAAKTKPQRTTSRPPARQPDQTIPQSPAPADAAASTLQITLNRSSDLARAVIYAEVLGKPMALRSAGSFDFGT